MIAWNSPPEPPPETTARFRWALLLSARTLGSEPDVPGEPPSKEGEMKGSPGALIWLAMQICVDELAGTLQVRPGVTSVRAAGARVTDCVPRFWKGTPSPKSARKNCTDTVVPPLVALAGARRDTRAEAKIGAPRIGWSPTTQSLTNGSGVDDVWFHTSLVS